MGFQVISIHNKMSHKNSMSLFWSGTGRIWKVTTFRVRFWPSQAYFLWSSFIYARSPTKTTTSIFFWHSRIHKCPFFFHHLSKLKALSVFVITKLNFFQIFKRLHYDISIIRSCWDWPLLIKFQRRLWFLLFNHPSNNLICSIRFPFFQFLLWFYQLVGNSDDLKWNNSWNMFICYCEQNNSFILDYNHQ